MRTPAFSELVGDTEKFFEYYYGRAPLLRQGALVGNPRDVLSAADLDEIIHQEAFQPSYVRMLKKGSPVDHKLFTRAVVRDRVHDLAIDADVAYERFRAGASIIWDSLNHYRPNLREFGGDLSEIFSSKVDVTAFASPAHCKATDVHCDPGDTFILQLEGSKHWQVWPTLPPDIYRQIKLGPETIGEPLYDVVLQPGDVLYMPQGTPHNVTPGDQMSLHITVLVWPRTWADLLRLTVDSVVSSDPEFSDFLNPGAQAVGVAADLEQKISALTKRLRALDMTEEVARLRRRGATGEGTSQGTLFQDMVAIDHINTKTVVARTASEIIFDAEDPEAGPVRINGNLVAMPPPVSAALRAMAVSDRMSAGSFVSDFSPDRSVAAVRSLARLGALALSTPT